LSATPNLAIEHILQSQAQKEVTANEAFDRLDEALNDLTTIDVSAGNTTVSADDFTRNVLLVLTGTPAGALDLTVPASKRLFIIQNDCGQDVAVTTGAGAQVLTSGQRRLLYGDGTNIVAIAPDFASTGGAGGGGGGGFPAFKGALIKRTTNVAIASSVQTTLGWESEVYDTDGFADVVAQPTRLTVPAGKGITRVQVLCGVQWGPSSSGDRWVEILKNGVEVDGLPGYLGPTDGNNRSRIALASAPIAVADGDYFECQVWQSASGSLDVEADPQTWFAVVAIEFAAFRGAMVKLAADEPVADSTDVAIPWDSIVYDTDSFWSAANPTRFTIPTGVTKVRLKANINWTFGGTGYRHFWMHKNSGPFFGMGRESDEGDAGVQSIGSAVVDVTAGDYFELIARQTSGATKNVAADELSWFAIELVE
jgi:hypothetical protein